MKEPNIFQFKVGVNRCYIIKQRGSIMVDGGSPNKIQSITNSFESFAVNPDEIRLVVLTHGHFDHAGSAKDVRNITGAQILIHEGDRHFLESAKMIWPPGVNAWGKISSKLFKGMLRNAVKFPETKADIVMDSKEFSLEEYGIDGKVVHTPGHTPGSLSVLLDSGDAFVGCMAHNGLPFRLQPGFPIYAEDIEQLKKSWEILIRMGAKTVYPGHGNPFPIDIIQRILEKEQRA